MISVLTQLHDEPCLWFLEGKGGDCIKCTRFHTSFKIRGTKSNWMLAGGRPSVSLLAEGRACTRPAGWRLGEWKNVTCEVFSVSPQIQSKPPEVVFLGASLTYIRNGLCSFSADCTKYLKSRRQNGTAE